MAITNKPIEITRGLPSDSNQTMRVQIGDVCCSLICHDGEIRNYLKKLYSEFQSPKPPDFSVELKIIDRLSTTELAEAMSQTRITLEGNRFMAKGLTFEGEFDIDHQTTSITLERNLLDPNLEYKLMNRLFLTVYYTACQAKYSQKPPAMLVHSCGILRHGQVLLFVGPCEAGKTTIAQLCGDRYGQVINDEMMLVSWPHGDSDLLLARGVPIIGGVPQRLNTAAPLRCVLALKQSYRTAVRRLDRLQAYLHFLHQVPLPSHFGDGNFHSLFSITTEFSDEITSRIPSYELEFTLERESLWPVIEELEGALEREGAI